MDYRLHEHYGRLNTPVHRLDPRTKLILVLAFVMIVVSTPPTYLLAFVFHAGLLCWAVALARVPLIYIGLRAAVVLPFSIFAAFWLPWLKGGPSVSLAGGSIQLSVAGLWLLAGVVMKSYLSASAVVLVSSTTPMNELLCGFRKLGMPVILVDMLALMHRYLFVLVEEALRLRRAAAARGYRPRWLGQALLIGRLIGQLFLRSYERAERVHGAMVLRGYRGQMPAARPLRLRAVDIATLLVSLTLLILVRGFAR